MPDGKAILVVDDAPPNLALLMEILSSEGYTVWTATSGARALKHLQTACPALILLDIQMPGIDGFETCRLIKSNAETAHIPIIFITGFSDTKKIAEGFSLGAVDYITKPFQRVELLARVSTHVQLNMLTQNLEQQVLERTAELRGLETRQRKLFETSPIGLVLCQMDGSLVDVNTAYADIIGCTIPEALQLTYWEITPEDYAAQEQLQLESLEKTGRYGPYEKEYIHKDGHRVPVQLSGILIEQDGETFIWSSVENISDRKQSEDALEAANEQLNLALKSGDLGYWRWNIATDNLYWDERLYELHGVPNQQKLNADVFRSTVHPDDIILLEELWQYAITNKNHQNQIGQSIPYEVIYRAVCPDGITNYIKAYGSILRDENGDATTILGIAVNITPFKQAEEQLELSNQKLKRASQMKDEFLASMSHELRTPLNAITGVTGILQEQLDGDLNLQQLDHLAVVQNSAKHLLNLINDILDLSKVRIGKIQLNLAPTAVENLCSASLPLIQQQAQAKRIQIQTIIPPGLPLLLMDPKRMGQVLINLLSNAVKFTPEGGHIIVTVFPNPVPDPTGTCPQGYLRITVSDTGIGIAPENMNKLFQPFVQIDGALNRQYGGTGLGLSLVKQFVELHGGKVSVNSTIAIGSIFTVDLPWSTSAISTTAATSPLLQTQSPTAVRAATKSQSPSQSTDAPIILLAEDDTANIYTFTSHLEFKGYNLAVARNGQEAIQLVQSLQPQLIIMDTQMPIMDGLQAITYIRQTLGLMDIPIIALTDLVSPEDEERCLAAGANDYLSKPLKLKELETLMQKHLSC